jgi:hypothetical protein
MIDFRLRPQRPQDFLIGDMRLRGPLREKRQLEVTAISNHDLALVGNMRCRTVPQVCPKISETIEEYLNPSRSGRPLKPLFTEGIVYFLHIMFFRCFPHTVEVTGSNPVSPIPSFSTTSLRFFPGRITTRPLTLTFWYKASIRRKEYSSAKRQVLKSATWASRSLLNSETWPAEMYSIPRARAMIANHYDIYKSLTQLIVC